MRKLVLWIASGAGSGYAPWASGTVGSAAALLLYLPLTALGPTGYLVALTGLVVIGTWAAGRAEVLLGHRDDGRITIDEFAGMLLALALLPARPDVVIIGFVLFRIFDIWKPPPADWAERLPAGLGVMADDLVAGLYANLLGQVLWRLVWPNGLL